MRAKPRRRGLLVATVVTLLALAAAGLVVWRAVRRHGVEGRLPPPYARFDERDAAAPSEDLDAAARAQLDAILERNQSRP